MASRRISSYPGGSKFNDDKGSIFSGHLYRIELKGESARKKYGNKLT